MKVLVHAPSAKVGGGSKYVRALACELLRSGSPHQFIFLVPPSQADAIRAGNPSLSLIVSDIALESRWRRLWFDQIELRKLLRREHVDVLFSAGNFGMLHAPCPQVLFVRNALYFSTHYDSTVLARKSLPARLEHAARRWLICRSSLEADIVMTPTRAMLDDLRRYAPVADDKAVINPFGTETAAGRALAPPAGGEPWLLLYTSFYYEYKDIGSLFRAVRDLSQRNCRVRLRTTADPTWEVARGSATWREDLDLASEARQRGQIEFLPIRATVPADLYAAAHIFVYPSAVESFGHPLVEAMSWGLPVVAAGAPVNRELCGDAALYFQPGNAQQFAASILQIIEDEELRHRLATAARARAQKFTWSAHLATLLHTLERAAGQARQSGSA